MTRDTMPCMPANDVNIAVTEERAHAAPHTTFAPKKTFESGLGE